jgi:hypothetical protein
MGGERSEPPSPEARAPPIAAHPLAPLLQGGEQECHISASTASAAPTAAGVPTSNHSP